MSLNQIDNMFMLVLEQSNLDPELKYHIQQKVDLDFAGNWHCLLEEIMQLAVDDEEYELAAGIRDYLNQNKDE